jgi:hypothetical protein
MLACAMIELAAQHAPLANDPAQCPQMFLLDGTPADSTLAGFLARAASVLPHAVSVVEYRQVEQAMERLSAELDKRQQAEASGGDLGSFHSVYVIVNGLQRFRMLRRAEDEFDFSSTADDKAQKPDKVFARLLREGPAAGMHVLLWCDTVGSLNRTLDRTALREFDSRVRVQMSQADSSALIAAAVAGTIGQNRALYYSEEQGLVEKFRPWALPDDAWLERVRKAMRRDGTSAAVR